MHPTTHFVKIFMKPSSSALSRTVGALLEVCAVSGCPEATVSRWIYAVFFVSVSLVVHVWMLTVMTETVPEVFWIRFIYISAAILTAYSAEQIFPNDVKRIRVWPYLHPRMYSTKSFFAWSGTICFVSRSIERISCVPRLIWIYLSHVPWTSDGCTLSQLVHPWMCQITSSGHYLSRWFRPITHDVPYWLLPSH